MKKVVYVTNWYPTFWLTFYLTDVHFRGELQQVDDVGEQKIKCRPVRTRDTAGVRLQDGNLWKLYIGADVWKYRLMTEKKTL